MPRTGLNCQATKVRPIPSTGFQLRRLSVQPKTRTSQAYPREMGSPKLKDSNHPKTELVHGEIVHAPYRSSQYHQKAESLGKVYPCSPVPSQAPMMVAARRQHPGRSILHPVQHAHQILTNTSNEGWGACLGDFTARGLLSIPESKLHINFLELKAVLLAHNIFTQFYLRDVAWADSELFHLGPIVAAQHIH